jgi:hypothetical protein
MIALAGFGRDSGPYSKDDSVAPNIRDVVLMKADVICAAAAMFSLLQDPSGRATL